MRFSGGIHFSFCYYGLLIYIFNFITERGANFVVDLKKITVNASPAFNTISSMKPLTNVTVTSFSLLLIVKN